MFSNFTQPMLELFASSLWETIVMVGISGLVGALIGVPLGVYLRLTAWWAASSMRCALRPSLFCWWRLFR